LKNIINLDRFFLYHEIQKTINKTEVLDFNEFYHVYNKALGNELLYKTENDYFFFSKKKMLERYFISLLKISSSVIQNPSIKIIKG